MVSYNLVVVLLATNSCPAEGHSAKLGNAVPYKKTALGFGFQKCHAAKLSIYLSLWPDLSRTVDMSAMIEVYENAGRDHGYEM